MHSRSFALLCCLLLASAFVMMTSSPLALAAAAGGTVAPRDQVSHASFSKVSGGTEYATPSASSPRHSAPARSVNVRAAGGTPPRAQAGVRRRAPKRASPKRVSPTPSLLTPMQTVAEGAVFPVAGAHSFGDAANRFGAPRKGHVHQGQDVLAAEGTPVLAPLPGRILLADFQAAGAGLYVVEQAKDGFSLMFAHCKAGSLATSAGHLVATGSEICEVGQTGDATGPHLHFEMWVGGWQTASGHPLNPLPYLKAWGAG